MSPKPNEAGYETHRVPSYDLDTPFDALEIEIGPSVCPLQCFEVEKDRRWVNRRRAEGQRPGSPPAEAEVEVRRSKVEAEGCRS